MRWLHGDSREASRERAQRQTQAGELNWELGEVDGSARDGDSEQRARDDGGGPHCGYIKN